MQRRPEGITQPNHFVKAEYFPLHVHTGENMDEAEKLSGEDSADGSPDSSFIMDSQPMSQPTVRTS